MKTAKIAVWLVLLAGFAGASVTEGGEQVPVSVKSSDDIAVVVNFRNDAKELSSTDLRDILLGERRFWKNREPLKLVLREPGTRERDQVIKSLLQMNNTEYNGHWRDKIFRGEASTAPLAVPSNGMASQYVCDTLGGITFVSGRNLRPDLKVLKIDGKMPGEPGYLLR